MFVRKSVVFIIITLTIDDYVSPYSRSLNSNGYEENKQESRLNFTGIAGKYGYLSEEHSVITEDGYELTIFRIRGRQCDKDKSRRPVLLMHGLLMSSDAFLDAGPKNALAFLIADACHDVWVGNCRGTYYSRTHTSLNPSDPKFWNFSVDEIGYYDVPAAINYILANTSDVKLNYIGFSQGAGTLLIMCSERPNFCDKVNILIALAPAARQTNTKSNLFRAITTICWKYESVLSQSGIYEVFGKGYRDFFSVYCKLNDEATDDCLSILSLLDSPHPKSISRLTVKSLVKHFPAGTSLHNMARYGQSMVSENFEKFDYGTNNRNIYGTKESPKYNITAATMPVVVIYGENDGMVDPKDVEWLVSQLPNVIESWLVPDPKWTHMDVMYSHHIPRLLFPKIKDYLLRYN